MLKTVEIKQSGPGKIEVRAEYHPDFPAAVRGLNGKFEKPYWYFDSRDEIRIREICRSIYGTDGTDGTSDKPTATIRATAVDDISQSAAGVYLLGRCIAYATGRDSGARLGGNVVLISGRASSGGSVKNWTTVIRKGSMFEIRDLPEGALSLPFNERQWQWQRYTPAGSQAEYATSLRQERDRLVRRLVEIDAELDELEDLGNQLTPQEALDPGVCCAIPD